MTNEELNKYAVMAYGKRQKLLQMERNLMMLLLTRDFRQRRKEQLFKLQEWEGELNKATEGKPPIKVENNVDLNEPPAGFTYVTQCKVNLSSTLKRNPNDTFLYRQEKELLYQTIPSLAASASIVLTIVNRAAVPCRARSRRTRKPAN